MSIYLEDADLERVARELAARTLPRSAWTHAAHFAAALWLLHERGLQTCLRQVPQMIRAYNEASGVHNTEYGGYHATITIASLRAGEAWLSARAPRPLHVTLTELLTGPYGRSDWPLAFWLPATLFGVAARRHWVDPDLKALPF